MQANAVCLHNPVKFCLSPLQFSQGLDDILLKMNLQITYPDSRLLFPPPFYTVRLDTSDATASRSRFLTASQPIHLDTCGRRRRMIQSGTGITQNTDSIDPSKARLQFPAKFHHQQCFSHQNIVPCSGEFSLMSHSRIFSPAVIPRRTRAQIFGALPLFLVCVRYASVLSCIVENHKLEMI